MVSFPGTVEVSINGEVLTNISIHDEHLPSALPKEIREYLEGKRKEFTYTPTQTGTPFQMAVWDAVCKIPYGETRSYKQIAEAIGNPRGHRAVANALNKNRIAIVVPCHRVTGSNGYIGGYGYGVAKKKWLMEREGIDTSVFKAK